jgi:tRNA-specific 2-thiouridylase
VATGQPIFVLHFDIAHNEIVLGDEADLLANNLITANLNFIPMDQIIQPMQAMVKIRYGAKEAQATILPLVNKRAEVVFKEPQRAVTPGQSVVFYQKDLVLGGGIIV